MHLTPLMGACKPSLQDVINIRVFFSCFKLILGFDFQGPIILHKKGKNGKRLMIFL